MVNAIAAECYRVGNARGEFGPGSRGTRCFRGPRSRTGWKTRTFSALALHGQSQLSASRTFVDERLTKGRISERWVCHHPARAQRWVCSAPARRCANQIGTAEKATSTTAMTLTIGA
jgi:hypothetical protein